MDAYEKLEERFTELGRLREVLSVLRWDDAVMMPSGGSNARAEQMAMLKGMHHDKLTADEVADWLDEISAEDLNGWQKANLREMRRTWLHASCVPADLIREFSRRSSECESVWRTARADDDFERLAPHLQKVVDLSRQIAGVKAEALGLEPYDALLDKFEPGMKSASIDEIFDDLAEFIPGFLEEVLQRQAERPEPVEPSQPVSEHLQRQLAEELMERLGFDFDHGRLDTSHHPFCGGYPEDVRLTTFYDQDNVLRAMMAVLHETGHALYNRGLPEDWRRQPVGEARSTGVHESQSLFVEMQMGRSRAFSRWSAPLFENAFDGEEAVWSADNLHRLKTRVQRSLIRVDADEVTYPAHVILRYRLEKAMIRGELEVEQLPAAWNEGMEELIGITPPDDRQGCMQDIHWMAGMFGYFPTYTLGALMAAQLFAACDDALGGAEELIEDGEFEPLIQWLRDNVHSMGCRLESDELIREATGQQLDPDFFKQHLRRRYLGEHA